MNAIALRISKVTDEIVYGCPKCYYPFSGISRSDLKFCLRCGTPIEWGRCIDRLPNRDKLSPDDTEGEKDIIDKLNSLINKTSK